MRSDLRASMLLLLVLSMGCARPEEPGGAPGEPAPPAALEPAAAAELVVEDARLVLSPGGVAAVYLTVDNPTAAADRLTAIQMGETPVSLHATRAEGTTMKMEARPEGYEIPAGGRLELAPGGRHGMAMGLPAMPEGSERVELVLTFERAGSLTVEARVEGVGQAMDHDHSP